MRAVLVLTLVLGAFSLAQSWSQETVDALVKEGIVYGYPDGEIRPEAYLKRGEAFTLLWRVILTYRLKDLKDLTREDIQNLKALLKKADELARALQDQGQVLQAYADAIKELRERLEKAQAESSTLAGTAREKAEEALTQTTSFAERLGNLEATTYKGLRDFREEVNGLGAALRDLDAKVKALEEALNGKTQEVQSRYSELQGLFAQVSGKVSALEAALSRVKDAEERLKALEDRVSVLEAQVKALREELVRLRGEIPKVERPSPLGVGVVLTSVSPLGGSLRVGYVLPQGFGGYARLTYDPLGFYAALGVAHVTVASPFSFKALLGIARGFYGPGFAYGEVGTGFGVKLFGDLGLGLEGVLSFPIGTGPNVARFGLGVVYGW
jgi:uncharacterized protein YoxC